jgi:hypothetical protein
MGRPRQGDEPYTMLSIRFPEWMVAAIDAHVATMHGSTPMVTLSRSDAVRDLVFRALKGRPGTGPVLPPADQTADHAPVLPDQSATPTAQRQARTRTTRSTRAAVQG